MRAMGLPLILDTDIGIDVDDAIALCLAALDPRIDLRAVTTVNGATEKGASLATALLRMCDRHDVPVGAGASNPLDGRAHDLMPIDHVDLPDQVGAVDAPYPTADEVLVDVLGAASAE